METTSPFFRQGDDQKCKLQREKFFPWLSKPTPCPAPQLRSTAEPLGLRTAVTFNSSKPAPQHTPQTGSWPQPKPKPPTPVTMTSSADNSKVLSQFPLIPSPHIPVGGRLKHFISQWYKLTHDPTVINMVKGCSVDRCLPLPSKTTMRELPMSSHESKAASEHIQSLLDKKAITVTDRCHGDFVSSVFLVPKKDGGFRMILNLKEFNKYATKISFKMETLQHILQLVHKNWFMTSIDLVDAYLVVPIRIQDQILLKFLFKGIIYMYLVLPFGYTGSPRIFTKILKPLIHRLRSLGFIVTFYLDDSWQTGATYDKCLTACKATYSLLVGCGFLPNLKKSKLVPAQKIQILGALVDSVNMTVSLPPHKERDMLSLLSDCLTCHHLTIRSLARLIGKLISCTIACPLGTMYYRNLERTKLRALRLSAWNWNATCRLSTECKQEMTWWLDNIPHCSAPIFRPNPRLTLTTDASSFGWGADFYGQKAGGHFSPAELPLSINSKETLAIWYGFRSFFHRLKGCDVLILSDNTTAVSYVRKMGGMQSELRCRIVQDLWNLCVSNEGWIQCSYLPGIHNYEADSASRILNERTEWMLHPSLFRQICSHFRIKPVIDLFASRLNKQLPRFYLFTPDPFTEHVDAFTIEWLHTNIYYMFPPFNLLNRAMQKIVTDRTTVLAVLPAWPNQSNLRFCRMSTKRHCVLIGGSPSAVS